ncbi:MAG: isochorismatase family protein [Bacteroidaceae bacterium]|nr:isochorismatase family protein [Bacteroidaceae bacterium]
MNKSIKNLSVFPAILAAVTFASCNYFTSSNKNIDSSNSSQSATVSSSEKTSDNMTSSNILVIVDLQKDFIDGTLPAKNGADVIAPIKGIIPQFDKVYFTLDWHPYNHCSFKAYGGIWPEHCVQYTEGASLPNGILEGVSNSRLRFLPKGNNPEREEYGQFEFMQADNQDLFRKGDKVVVCGIAAEYCVLETLKNLVRLSKVIGFNLYVFNEGVACIETNDPLLDYMKENNIKFYK